MRGGITRGSQLYSKVPEVTLGFWIIKILATTLGETGGDSVTMTWLKADVMVNLGYLIGSAIFFSVLIVLVIIQIAAKKFHPFLYWATIVASTTFGTALADFATRSLGIGYTGGSLLLFGCVMLVLALWYWSEGTISVNTVSTPRVEAFYWTAITFSQTLGTALGDWIADTGGLGYQGGALVFAAALAVTAALYFRTDVSRFALFWAAFILTRPLGATLGDFLDKPLDHGGLALSRPIASAIILAIMIGLIVALPQRAGVHPANGRPMPSDDPASRALPDHNSTTPSWIGRKNLTSLSSLPFWWCYWQTGIQCIFRYRSRLRRGAILVLVARLDLGYFSKPPLLALVDPSHERTLRTGRGLPPQFSAGALRDCQLVRIPDRPGAIWRPAAVSGRQLFSPRCR